MQKLIALTIFILLAACASTPRKASREVTDPILVTFFEPFGGSKVNMSASVAEQFKEELERLDTHVGVTLCQLPVEYDKAPARALECYNNMSQKPGLVIGLGEGNCKMRLEVAANNLDDTPKFPDNGGLERVKHPIIPGKPKRQAFSFPVQELYCAIPSSQKHRFVVSGTPGNYVCNNLAFTMSAILKGPQFTFVHVPHSGCTAEEQDPVRNGTTLANMFYSVRMLNLRTPVSAAALPATSKELKRLKGKEVRSCEQEFLQSLEQQYSALKL
jgi:pyrrolidone-carboxylate peptidase